MIPHELQAIAKEHGLLLIEDNAQSPGARYRGNLAGTIGDIGVLSLNYYKAIQVGEGGIALTNNPDLALRMQLVRNHGEVVVADIGMEDWPNQLGWNYRLTEVSAAIGIPQIAKLDYLIGIRRKLASLLTDGLRDFEFISTPLTEEGCTHSYYFYPMRYHKERLGIDRTLFVKAVRAEGISLSEAYVKPIYLEPMYQKRMVYGRKGCPFTCGHYEGKIDYNKGICPVTEKLHFFELITTDICKYPNTEREVEEFVTAIAKIKNNVGSLES